MKSLVKNPKQKRQTIAPALCGLFFLAALGASAQAQQPTKEQWAASPELHSAAISVYHHVSNATPASTSISPEQFEEHLRALNDLEFTVSPLAEVVKTVLAGAVVKPKTVAITFDDGYESIYTTALPLLQRYDMPFTLFISTGPIDRNQRGYLSWTQLRELAAAGVTIGNHGSEHDSALSLNAAELRADILHAQRRIDEELGPQEKFFAYPYGEFNSRAQTVVAELGYLGFAQNSGAIGPTTSPLALPRFPLAGIYAELDSAQQKYATLAFPLETNTVIDPSTRPEYLSLQLQFHSENWRDGTLNCFDAGKPVRLEHDDQTFTLTLNEQPQKIRRWLTTCTARHPETGRYFWYSQPWTETQWPL